MKSARHTWLMAGVFFLCALGCSFSQAKNSDSLPTFVVPDVAKKFTLIAYGDVRFTDPKDNVHTNPQARVALVNKIAQEKPAALLISGDLPYRGAKDKDWQVFDQEFKPIWDAKARVYPAIGDHEVMEGEARALQNWWKRFPDINNMRWYSVLFGNCYFIILDSKTTLEEGTPQGQWLNGQLAHIPVEVDFVFLVLHHPSYTDSHDHLMGMGHSARGQEQRLSEKLEAMQPTTRARLIEVAGHVHNYERFEHNSVTYIVDGGGGATPYLLHRSADDKYRGGEGITYNYVKLEIDGPHLKGTMFKLDTDNGEYKKFDAKDTFGLDAAPLKNPAITGTTAVPR